MITVGHKIIEFAAETERETWKAAALAIERRCKAQGYHGNSEVCHICKSHAQSLRRRAARVKP